MSDKKKMKISTDELFANAISLYHEKRDKLEKDTYAQFSSLMRKQMKDGKKKKYIRKDIMRMFRFATRNVLTKYGRELKDDVLENFDKDLAKKGPDFKFSEQMIAPRLKKYVDGNIVYSEFEMFSLQIECLFDEIKLYLIKGYRVVLSGFGSFSVAIHKGHPVQFGATNKKVADYPVCKFVPANVLSDYIRANY